jgi:hypothetical protein
MGTSVICWKKPAEKGVDCTFAHNGSLRERSTVSEHPTFPFTIGPKFIDRER